ncbi:hypothetical protein P7B02_16575 [Caulobacter segnis]|uniref:hypothetical protein n=1 Tax=Caulobacter segnis TaxID=88688 RepID=UPI00241071A0|nr:hypothetical protein [Caulobacter segnis]MDG2523147.1 hypothetical protein [Caulobacter segnis]
MSTYSTLDSIYRNLHRIPADKPLSTDAAAQLKMMADGIDASNAGQVGTGWNFKGAMAWILDSVNATSAVAIATYGFLTDTSLTGGGLDYLVSAHGSNPNNLNSAYYKGFSLENRYINFAVNIAKEPGSQAKFLTDYAPLTLAETLKKAYGQIFGASKTDAEFSAMLTPERAAYFASYGGDGANGVGTKAALIGWLLAEAVKADAGPYALAVKNMLLDIADDGSTHASNRFLASWGPGGDYAQGGASAPGLPGEKVVIQSNWNVDVTKPSPTSNVHAVATEGDDVIVSTTGLELGASIHTRGGNDTITISGGLTRGDIDSGSGNDVIVVSGADGQITTGTGHDWVQITGFGPLHNHGIVPDIIPTAIITDFEQGKDYVGFNAELGAGAKLDIQTAYLWRAGATLQDALTVVAGMTAAGKNSVFEWNGNTYVFHQNGKAELELEDGLVMLAGVTGLSVANGPQMAGDIHFG